MLVGEKKKIYIYINNNNNNKVSKRKVSKYAGLWTSHLFVPIAIETQYGELSRKRRHQRTRSQSDCHEQLGNTQMERPWFRGRSENHWRHSPRHLYRIAHTIYIDLSLCSRREVCCEQDDKLRHQRVNPLAHSHRCGDNRCLVLRVGGNSLRISAGESPSSLESRWRERISFRWYQWHYRETMQSLFATQS